MHQQEEFVRLVRDLCTSAVVLETIPRKRDAEGANRLYANWQKKVLVLDVGSLSQDFGENDFPLVNALKGSRNQCGYYATRNYMCFEKQLLPRLEKMWEIFSNISTGKRNTSNKQTDLHSISGYSATIKRELKDLFEVLHDRSRFVKFYSEMLLHQATSLFLFIKLKCTKTNSIGKESSTFVAFVLDTGPIKTPL